MNIDGSTTRYGARMVMLAALLSVAAMAGILILRPNSSSANGSGGCTGINDGSDLLPNAYDSSDTTASTVTMTRTAIGAHNTATKVTGFGLRNAGSGAALIVKTSCTNNSDPSGAGQCVARYSLNAGGSWSTLRSSTVGWGTTTDNVALPAGQQLADIWTDFCARAAGNGSTDTGEFSLAVYDVRVEDTATGSKFRVEATD